MDYSLRFDDRVAIITGAASGIGKATAHGLAGHGARVAIFDRDEKKGTEVASALDGSIFCLVDVTDPASVDAAVRDVLQSFETDTIDVLVNNAGFEDESVGNLVDMPYEILDRIFKINTYGYVHCARSILPHMARGGRVVNVSSVQALAAIVPGTSYQASKTAVFGITNALAVEYAGQGITVNTVCPGAIKTEGMGDLPADDPALDAYRKRIPLGRRGHAEEVAAAILFLCSGMASYITGATIPVDGGYAINGTPDSLARTVDVPAEDDPDS